MVPRGQSSADLFHLFPDRSTPLPLFGIAYRENLSTIASGEGGIKEDVPLKYRARFAKWKAEFVSTEIGKNQWNSYANNRNFTLVIKVSGTRGKGAGTDKFVWDDAGHLIGATITLGSDLHSGYPDPIYYPVLNSLAPVGTAAEIDGAILAATKISHEIGHVNQAAQADVKFMRLQDDLMSEYTSIFLKNGLNTQDKKLVELAAQMGGTPIEIWESREYWSEVNAMLFLNEKIGKQDSYCYIFNKIRTNLNTYARDYEQRFGQYPQYSESVCRK